MDTSRTYNQGENVYFVDGERTTYSDPGRRHRAARPADPRRARRGRCPPRPDGDGDPIDAPWEAAHAADWDSQTLESWIDENSVIRALPRLVPVATRPIFGTEPRELSLLFTLFYIAASGDENNVGTFERNFNTRDGAQMFRFVGGSQVLCDRARAASSAGASCCARPVGRIVQGKGGVRVESKRRDVHGQARDRGGARPCSPAGSTSSPSCRRAASSSASGWRRAR